MRIARRATGPKAAAPGAPRAAERDEGADQRERVARSRRALGLAVYRRMGAADVDADAAARLLLRSAPGVARLPSPTGFV